MTNKRRFLAGAMILTLTLLASYALSDDPFEPFGAFSCCGDTICNTLHTNQSCPGHSNGECGQGGHCCVDRCNNPDGDN